MQKNSPRGFTLIELLVVIVLILILATIGYPAYTKTQERARATQDMSNLRQIGLATQMYLNDNDGVLFSASLSWMKQLHPKYLPAWAIFQSPFDRRAATEDDTNSPVSYGLNGNPSGSSIAGLSTDKILNPSVFIIFAPAQQSGSTVAFDPTAIAGTAAPGVTVYKSTSAPGGTATGGTHGSRLRINALFADSHSESLLWNIFKNDTPNSSDPTANLRWAPYTPYP
jgi:prepilin-type N-terminal cleavage/methylation domain-containing protein